MPDLRPKLETGLVAVEGDLLSALTALGDDGWSIIQLLPQPDGKVMVLSQRPRLAVITDLTGTPPNILGVRS